MVTAVEFSATDTPAVAPPPLEVIDRRLLVHILGGEPEVLTGEGAGSVCSHNPDIINAVLAAFSGDANIGRVLVIRGSDETKSAR